MTCPPSQKRTARPFSSNDSKEAFEKSQIDVPSTLTLPRRNGGQPSFREYAIEDPAGRLLDRSSTTRRSSFRKTIRSWCGFASGNSCGWAIDHSIPVYEDLIWSNLTFTKSLEKGSLGWTGKVRGSLVRLDDKDGKFPAETLTAQSASRTPYPLDEHDRRKLAMHLVNRPDKVVSVSVPDDSPTTEVQPAEPPEVETRESIRVQALIAQIGARMGLSVWVPKADRGGVLREWKSDDKKIIDRLPLNYDDTALRTIEQIDVLWLRGRSIVRAFEVEHTTSVYSGILRMADLLALQPNMDIKLHIVAPVSKREKVFQEIRRPVFSLLEKGPLAESCTYLSYDSLRELGAQRHLAHLSDTVLDEYAEVAE